MGSDSARVAAVIPAYNEALTVREVVTRALSVVDAVYVVDDGSTDGTADALSGLPARLLRHAANRGKGDSLRTGFCHALADGYPLVVTLDADGQHPPEAIAELLAAAGRAPGALVVGRRHDKARHAPPGRRLSNAIADFFISWAAGRRLADTQSGFRLYPRALLEPVAAGAAVHHGRFAFESEVLIEAVRRGVPVVAVDVPCVYARAARPSHYRPLLDAAGIARVVATRLLRRGLYPRGLWRVITGR